VYTCAGITGEWLRAPPKLDTRPACWLELLVDSSLNKCDAVTAAHRASTSCARAYTCRRARFPACWCSHSSGRKSVPACFDSLLQGASLPAPSQAVPVTVSLYTLLKQQHTVRVALKHGNRRWILMEEGRCFGRRWTREANSARTEAPRELRFGVLMVVKVEFALQMPP
jgi:hypothetical protein